MVETRKVLLTGISGQAGSFLAELYVKKRWEVHGFVRQRTNLVFLSNVIDKIELHLQDIRDPHGVWASIHDLKPDVIHHLAAMTYVPYSWANPYDTFQTNVMASINIIQAVRSDSPDTVLVGAGSSEEYGELSPEQTPTSEDTIPQPASPYGVSKYAMDLLLQQAHRSYGMKTVTTRAFNHESSRRGEQFVSIQVVKQALEIKYGKRKEFSLGNLESVRDYSDVRDIVEAYYICATSGDIAYGQAYNICSGVGHTVREMVDVVSGIVGISAKVRQDPSKMRLSDIPVMIGDSTKFRLATGWKPRYSFEDTMRWMVEELEEQIYGK